MRLPATMLLVLVLAFVCGSCHHPSEQPAGEEPAPTEGASAANTEMMEDPTPGEVVAHGVVTGRSGKPLAGARLSLAEIIDAGDIQNAALKLMPEVDAAVADQEGKFEFKGFTPGTYSIVYQPRGTTGAPVKELSIGVLWGADVSIAPGLQGTELGTSTPFSDRPWGKVFVLLDGHTLNAQGKSMTVRNATARAGDTGPYLEWRNSNVWSDDFEDNGEVQFTAWSF